MRFQKGDKKPENSGRKKGVGNKRTPLFDICDAAGLDVFAEMVKIAKKEKNPNAKFFKLNEIMPYLYAKQKEPIVFNNTIEISESSVELQVRIDQLKRKT